MEAKLRYYIDENTPKEIDSTIQVIEAVGIGKNETKKVLFNEQEIGFYKNSSLTTNGMLDDLEFFLSIFGKYILDIDIADTLKVYDKDNASIGIISKNVAKSNERLIMFSDIVDILEEDNPEIKMQYNQVLDMRKRNSQTFIRGNGEPYERPVLKDEEDILLAINMFPKALDYINISPEEKEQIKKDYFKMIVFDLLINQADRNNGNYGIINNKDTNQTRFSTLFDNSTIHIPGIPKNFYHLNGFLIDKTRMLTCLLDNYREYVGDFINSIVDNKDDILTRTEKIASQELTKDEQNWFMPIFRNNLNTMHEITQEKRNDPKK